MYTNTTKKSEEGGLWHANLLVCYSISVLLQVKRQQPGEKKEVPGAKMTTRQFLVWHTRQVFQSSRSLLVLSHIQMSKTGGHLLILQIVSLLSFKLFHELKIVHVEGSFLVFFCSHCTNWKLFRSFTLVFLPPASVYFVLVYAICCAHAVF